MKASRGRPAAMIGSKNTFAFKTLSRRELLATSAAAGAMAVLHGKPTAATDGKKTFTILHTNDLHSNLIGMSPEADYTPLLAE
jgi:5'-nucleotidase / UDP-sugar diphosphatase